MTNFEKDPFYYQGSEAEKADLAAREAAEAGKWEDFMRESTAKSAELIKQAEMPQRPPEYRDFKGTTGI